MSNIESNFPSNQLNKLEDDKGFCGNVTKSIKQLADMGKPVGDYDMQNRVDQYFEFCATNDFRPGIESLCLALGITRQTLWRWTDGQDCTQKRKEIAQQAKQFIIAFLEQSTMKGKLNPASSIFYLKNWANYKDVVELPPVSSTERAKSLEEIAAEHGLTQLINQNNEMPEADF